MNSSFYKEIITKLELLIKKEYTAHFLIGLVITVIIIIAGFTVFSLVELIGNFNSIVRTILLFVFVLTILGATSYLILIPILKYFNIFKKWDYFYSAAKVGKQFPEIKDDLLNAMQLVSSGKTKIIYSPSLLDAAFKNVYERSKPIRFESIVDFAKVKKFSIYFLLVFVLSALVFGFVPGLQAASHRLINFNQEFIPPAKFYFEIYPGNTEITKGENVDFIIRIKGEMPKKVFLLTREESQTNFEEHELKKDSVGDYNFSIQQLRSSLNYFAFAEDIKSEESKIKVIDRPVIRSLDVKVISPGYSNIPVLEQKDNGNISALVGSTVEISLLSNKELKSAQIEFEDTTKINLSVKNNFVKGSFRIKKDNSYVILLQDLNENQNLQPVRYYLKAIYDSTPTIELAYPKQDINLANDSRVPIEVKINDDYGFSKLNLNYKLAASKYEAPQEKFTSIEIVFDKRIKEQIIDHIWNLTQINPAVNDVYSFYLEIFDNDNISGPKSAKTQIINVRVPSLDEILTNADETQDNVQDEMQETLKEAEELKKELEKIDKDLKQDKQEITWEEKEKIEQTLDKFEKLQEKIETASEQLKQMQNELQQNQLLSEETLEKYMELQKLMDEMTSDEMKKAMQKMQDALEKMNRNQTQDAMNQMKMDEEKFKKSIERTMNLLKRIQIEQKMDEMVKRAENLEQKQNELSEETKKSDLSDQKKSEELSNKQDEISKELDRLKEKMDDLKDKMSELKDMPNEEMEKLQEEFEKQKNEELSDQTKQDLKQNQKQKAQKNQQQLSKNMQQMKSSMQQMQEQMQQENQMQTFTDMMRILDNILSLSKQQEELKNKLQNVDPNSSQFEQNLQKQNEIKKNLNKLLDQMSELSQKTFAISPEMGKALGNANQKMNQSMQSMQNRNGSMATLSQGDAMMHLNEAANMMKSSLESMMQGGNGSGGMMSLMQQLQKMSGQQMDLNNMTQMLQQMQQGQMSPEQQGQMQRLAQQQQLIQKSLEQLNKEAKQSGESKKIPADLENIVNQMREVVTDMNTEKLTDDLIQKQEKILSKLLDAQRSINERDFEKERKSESGNNFTRNSPVELNLSNQKGKEKLKDELNRAVQEGYSKDYEDLIRKYYDALEREKINN
ncbi:MAG: hypothetical protein IPJ23_15890 [Ignavibacteriales bacterium]|nr:hypothetical protein [Ignavibacteriales bacterium]